MANRRTQRIREQLRQHPNPRAGRSSVSPSLMEHMHRVYGSAPTAPASSPHSQLAQRMEARRKRQR